MSPQNPFTAVDESFAADVLQLFSGICDRTTAALALNEDWGGSGHRDDQYAVDLVLDEICVVPLVGEGFTVLSEESGVTTPDVESRGTVVVDPLDGSTNAGLGLPWCATSLCLVVDGLAVVSTVANLRTGERFTAARGLGAWHGGTRLAPPAPVALGEAIVAVSGWPDHPYGWRQFRALGAAALDLCAVATGAFAGYVDIDDAHGPWDYLGGQLVVEEAGGVVVDAGGRDLVTLDHDARRAPVAAAGPRLLDELLAQRRR